MLKPLVYMSINLSVLSFFALIYLNRHFSEKTENYKKRIQRKWCNKTAELQAEGFKDVFQEREVKDSEEFTECLEKFYSDAYMKQFETVDMLSRAKKPSNWLNYSYLCFWCSLVSLLTAGGITYISYPKFAFPAFLLGAVLIILGTFYVLKIAREI